MTSTEVQSEADDTIANPTTDPITGFDDGHIVSVAKQHSRTTQTRHSSADDTSTMGHVHFVTYRYTTVLFHSGALGT